MYLKSKVRSGLVALVIALLLLVALVNVNVPQAHANAFTHKHSNACVGITHPTPLGVLPSPYLKVPFSETLSRHSLYISNGWLMAKDEIPIAGTSPHRALDFEFVNSPNHGYGYPVFAASDGCAYASYQYLSQYEPDPVTGVITQYGLGAGLVVELRDPYGYVQQYIHLSVTMPFIPFVGATAVTDPQDPNHPDWSPTGLFQTASALFSQGVQVKQGQLLGFQGDTGIGKNWKDRFDPKHGIVFPRNRLLFPPWDPTQLHFQVYQGRDGSFVKQNIVDPFGLNAEITGPGAGNPYSPKPGDLTPGPKSLFELNPDGSLEYAAA